MDLGVSPAAAEAWDKATLDAAPVGMAVVDASGDLQRANAPALALLGGEGSAEATWQRQVRPAVLAAFPDAGTPRGVTRAEVSLGGLGRRHLRIRMSPLARGGAVVVLVDISEAVAQVRSIARDGTAYRVLAEESADAHLVVHDHEIVWASPATRWVLGHDPDHLVGTDTRDLLPPPDRAHPPEVTTDGVVTRFRARLRTGSGDLRWFEARIKGAATTDNWPSLFYAAVRDVTAEVELSRRVERLEANTRAVLDAVRGILVSGDGPAAVVSAATKIADAVVACLFQPDGHGDLVVTAAHQPSLIGMRVPLDAPSAAATCYHSSTPIWSDSVPDDTRVDQALMSQAEGLVEATVHSAVWYPVMHDGRCLAVLGVGCGPQAEPPRSQEESLALLASEAALALHHQQLLHELERLSALDPLTGVANRRTWQHVVDRELPQAARLRAPLSVLMIDLDHFKQYNDVHGHAAADAALRAAADAWQERLRPGDLLCRWGGEEFVVLLPWCSAAGAAVVADDLRSCTPPGITCSVGVAEWDRTQTIDELLRRADEALYEAKHAGRDCVRSS